MLTYPFVSADRFDELALPADSTRRRAVRLANPLDEALPLLRTTVLATLMDAVEGEPWSGRE